MLSCSRFSAYNGPELRSCNSAEGGPFSGATPDIPGAVRNARGIRIPPIIGSNPIPGTALLQRPSRCRDSGLYRLFHESLDSPDILDSSYGRCRDSQLSPESLEPKGASSASARSLWSRRSGKERSTRSTCTTSARPEPQRRRSSDVLLVSRGTSCVDGDWNGPRRRGLRPTSQTGLIRSQFSVRQVVRLDQREDRVPEQERILPVVESKAEFVQVGRQVLDGKLVVRADDGTLEQAPSAFD